MLSSPDGWRVEAVGGTGGDIDAAGTGSFGGGAGGVINDPIPGGFGTFGSGGSTGKVDSALPVARVAALSEAEGVAVQEAATAEPAASTRHLPSQELRVRSRVRGEEAAAAPCLEAGGEAGGDGADGQIVIRWIGPPAD